jgi:hypothetical protein
VAGVFRQRKLAGWSRIGENHMDVILEREWLMTIGTTPNQADLWRGTAAVCEGRVGEQSIWAVLYHHGDRLVADELFTDLFAGVGRRSVPPRIVATVMVLQRLQGRSDREAVEAFCFDARWKYACGGLPYDYPGFSHTVSSCSGLPWRPQRRRGSSRPLRDPARPDRTVPPADRGQGVVAQDLALSSPMWA